LSVPEAVRNTKNQGFAATVSFECPLMIRVDLNVAITGWWFIGCDFSKSPRGQVHSSVKVVEHSSTLRIIYFNYSEEFKRN
jgi:hypothetical protein